MSTGTTPSMKMTGDVTRACLAEAIGTGAFVFVTIGAVCMNAWRMELGPTGVALASGMMLAVMTAATSHISGGHLNPAITLALLAGSRIRTSRAVMYIASQISGALTACVLLALFFAVGSRDSGFGEELNYAVHEVFLGTPFLAPSVMSPVSGAVVEGLLTFVLVFAFYATMIDPRRPAMGGVLVGMAYAALMMAGGPLTGGVMNPARAFGPLVGGGRLTLDLWSQQWVFWAGPILGALLACGVYESSILPRMARPVRSQTE